MRSARPPARWDAVQERFEAALAKDPSQFDRTPIRLVWWTVADHQLGTKGQRIWRGIVQALTQGTAADWFDGTYVAVYAINGPAGSYADLILEVPPESLPEPEGFGEAELVGEYLANGACALDLDDLGVAFPKAPPFTRRVGVPLAPPALDEME